jgi:hypothetical protein
MRCTTAAAVLLAVLPLACADRDLPTAADPPQTDIVPLAVVLTVENTNDDGPGSLRQTIADAQNGHVITFAPALAGEVITLSSELLLTKSVTIQGPAAGITLQGSGDHRILRMGALYEVVLENLIIRGGHTSNSGVWPGLGGGIFNDGANLTIRNSTIEHNWAQGWGGGIFNGGFGTLLITGSTIAYNGFDASLGATQFGGGIANSRADLVLVNSTVSANTAADVGGGLLNFEGGSTLIHATIADNGATFGGGIFIRGSEAYPASIDIRNSIVAANSSTSATSGPDIYQYIFGPPEWYAVNASFSLLGTSTGYAITSDGGGNQIGVSAGFVLDAYGKPLLADNGGPTRTHALMDGSAAIDSADPVVCDAPPVSNLDQRGVVRPQGVNCDMGSLEATDAAPPPPPAVVTALSIAAQGSVDRSSGDAVVRGSITCSTPGPVQLSATLVQEQKQRGVTNSVEAANTITIECAGTAAWAIGMTADNGIFSNGKAEASVAIDVAGPGPQTATVQLFWNK